jgi:DNA-binding MarR family transcriptional regulator
VGKHGAARDEGRNAGGTGRVGDNRLRNLRAKRAERPAETTVRSQAAARAEDLDRLIHERLRLGIVSALAVNSSLSFSDLKKLMRTTDGNLSVHARKLEEAEYIACTKSFEGRMPKTQYRLTPTGRKALERYLDHMEALISATRER